MFRDLGFKVQFKQLTHRQTRQPAWTSRSNSYVLPSILQEEDVRPPGPRNSFSHGPQVQTWGADHIQRRVNVREGRSFTKTQPLCLNWTVFCRSKPVPEPSPAWAKTFAVMSLQVHLLLSWSPCFHLLSAGVCESTFQQAACKQIPISESVSQINFTVYPDSQPIALFFKWLS